MTLDLTGRAAIVTGGGTGIGAAVSRKLAARGADVVIGYSRSRDEAEATAEACRALGVTAVTVQADVTLDAQAAGLASTALERLGRIDMLVNSAGATRFARHADLDALSGDDFLDVYRVNVVGAYQAIRAAAPAMKAGGRGAIVNIASLAGVYGSGSSSAYACSKGALITLTRSMARALSPEIRVNAVCPGFVGTRWFSDRLDEEAYSAAIARVEAATLLAHAGTPEEVADGVVFLCAEGAALITGETLLMDAGAHLDIALARP